MSKKRIYLIAACAVLAISLSGCGSQKDAARKTGGQAGVDEVMKAEMAKADAAAASAVVSAVEEAVSSAEKAVSEVEAAVAATAADAAEESVSSPAEKPDEKTADGVDVDLTAFSGMILYSEVYSIMEDPKSYLGKTIKMRGKSAVYHDEGNGNDYYSCVIQDATACCALGIEFVLDDPDAYPESGKDITVQGTFDSYTESGSNYYTLSGAELL